jgi:hypothetical protein
MTGAIAMARFRKVPHVVDAIRFAHSGTLDTPQGTIKYGAGDWLITGVEGEQYTIPHDRFKKLYEPSDDESVLYFKQVT